MNADQYPIRQDRLAAAALAALASTLVLSSVLWLFAGVGSAAVRASTAVVHVQPPAARA
jgi:hypothetical protein